MDLKKHYSNLWNAALQRYKNNAFEYDRFIGSRNDLRYGVTLIAEPSREVKDAIQRMLQELRKTDPNQYYYPHSDIHITILTIISCYPGFSLKNINVPAYSKLIKKALTHTKSFNIRFKGITASPSCILLQGFPDGNELNLIRNRLRDLFNESKLQQSIDSRYSIITAHSTIVRFRQTINNNHEFIKKLLSFRDKDFGTCAINELDFVGNDWYQQKQKRVLLEKFILN